jgi:ribonuclease HI
MAKVTIYTDGACEPNPGRGGWGTILEWKTPSGKRTKEFSGSEDDTTNNRMEIMAVLVGLRKLKYPCNVTIYTDSRYVADSIGNWKKGKPDRRIGWMVNWSKRNWTRREGQLKNKDLWQEIYKQVIAQSSVTMRWVKGHNGHEMNERCDVLAVEARLRTDNE